MLLPQLVAWNCRGSGSVVALRHLMLLIKINKPDILILEELRCSSSAMDKIKQKMKFSGSIVVEVVGFSGGIWILWDESVLSLELITLDE